METAASIVAVLQVSEKVIGYIRSASGATEDRKRLRALVRACSNILLTIRDGIEDSEEGQAWAGTVRLLASPLSRLQTALELAAIKLQTRDCTKEKFKWPFKEKEVQKLIEAIESEKSLLILALENSSSRLLHEINIRSKESNMYLYDLTTLLSAHVTGTRFDARDLKSAIAMIRDAQINMHEGLSIMGEVRERRDLAKLRLKILDWLSPIDHALQQHDKISRRQAGTCEWFLSSESYQTWLCTSGRILFCPGIPGAGKTIVASSVVADLWDRVKQDETVAVAFFFCEFGKQDEQTVDAMMLSILKQLVERRVSPSSSTQLLYDQSGEGIKRPLHDDIMIALQSETGSYESVYIVVDALDECRFAREVLSGLFSLQKQFGINFLATSRPVPEIQNLFQGTTQVAIHASNEDVKLYLEAQIQKTPYFARLSHTLQEEVKIGIIQSVQGMFLLAKLHLESLDGKRSNKMLRVALKGLSTGQGAYNSAYSSAMERIESQVPDQVELAKQVLSWIVHAKRAMRTLEIQEALGVEPGLSGIDRDNCPLVDDMVSACCGLVTINEGTNTMRLTHYTTQEYFVRTKQAWFPEAEAMIARQCLTYLAFDVWGLRYRALGAGDDPKYVLYRYATQRWAEHAKSAPSELPLVLEFVRRPRNLANSLQYLFHFDQFGRCSSGIHATAGFGLLEATRILLDESTDPNTETSSGTTPLIYAAIGGHLPIVKLLLERGAAINKHNKRGYTPLYSAVEYRNKAVADHLLECHADARNQSLHSAVQRSFFDMVKPLLDAGADANRQDADGDLPIHLLSANSDTFMVKTLLEAGTEINHCGYKGRTPLHVACANTGATVVKILLQNKADPNPSNYIGKSPLGVACWRGNEVITQMLLDAGADLNHLDDESNSALHYACRAGHEAIAKLLLEGGIEVYHVNKLGQTALFNACLGSHEVIVRLLLESGVDFDHKDNNGKSALDISRQGKAGPIVQMLLDQGATEIDIQPPPLAFESSSTLPSDREGKVSEIQLMPADAESSRTFSI
ncbi:hypothetical protein HBI38_155770 [Parastagonospora nodorum]|nr:hypothetical protein HBI10_150840 [Parastagonospora nodorum]KAH4009172.1 hypothetical protein HBI13_224910 [Parastagonospora nodorum]KAH4894806.1 hypothetical protein HBH74_195420 [Parastagonospora nodorum]KAH4933118.1 hypothetical protein HBH73_183930 [Parastagonospora nodorum]KAH4962673.1 hypothetical protein HBI78_129920 [Parastagonospora nodorum]